MAKKKEAPVNTEATTVAEPTAAAAPEAPAAKPKKEKAPKPVKNKIEQNGITRPEPGTKTGAVWDICDKISANTGQPADRKSVIEAGKLEGLNEATITTQHGRWREFHGLVNKRAPKDPVAAEAGITPATGVVEPA